MPRKRTTKDFAISMDEFHPRPSTAAAFADRRANDATQEHLRSDLKRVEAQLELAGDDKARLLAERDRLTALLDATLEDRKRIDEIIAEAKVK